jgi:glycine cleavage system P protein (glycine dehydrogenase) subunit 1
MPFVPNTDEDRRIMLENIGVARFDELIDHIPEEIRFKGDLELEAALSELEVVKLLTDMSNKNSHASNNACFLGAGAYDHFVPSIVGMVLERPEFKTAYTPYQAEVSQGTLQAMYEFQSMIAELTGMDVANASLYDGGSAMAEACLMSCAQNKRKEFVFAGTINPQYIKVTETVCAGREFTYKHCVTEDGSCDLAALKEAVSKSTSAVIVQQPNFYGTIEEVEEIEKIAHESGCMFVASVDPVTLSVLKTPGEYNADIVIGEGQSLGIPLNLGGPYLGLFATKQKFVRKIPGRLSGVTEDQDGKRGFVLTLQTREQQIKREKATSNICTNQGLFMLAATVYMATMGKQGLKKVSDQCFQKAHYLAEEICKIDGFSLVSDRPFFREFLVKTPIPADKILVEAKKEGLLAGLATSRFEACQDGLLIAVTEKRSKEEMDKLVEVMKRF